MWVINMFMGEYRHNLDAKGRVTLPSKFRDKYESIVTVTRGFDGCLSVYTEEEWENFYSQLQKIPSNRKQARTFIRLIISKATQCEIDKMGRINIPNHLRTVASLTKECAIVGAGNHVEIWDSVTWDSYLEEEAANLEEIAEELDGFDF